MNNSAYRLRSISLTHFRNYANAVLELSPGFNVVYGPNAQGKTNILEAMHLLSSARLLRTTRDTEAIQNGKTSASVSGELEPNETELKIVLEKGTRKRAFVNGIGLKRASDILGRFPSVAISAIDLDIVRGEPAERRLFLDLELSQTFPRYLDHLAQYRRALDQRNALLKLARESSVDEDQFETWEAPLSEHGSELRKQRLDFVARLSEVATAIHPSIAPSETIAFGYELKDDSVDSNEMELAFARSRTIDIARGSTTIGPHRDDISIQIDDLDVRSYGSQGQQRSAAITLKLAASTLTGEILGAAPALLLDDVFSDLDEHRRRRLVEWVTSYRGQTLLTCTEPESAGTAILSQAKLFRIQSGVVTIE